MKESSYMNRDTWRFSVDIFPALLTGTLLAVSTNQITSKSLSKFKFASSVSMHVGEAGQT